MKTGRQLILKSAAEIAFILLLHTALLYWLAKKQVVAAILSAGDHVPAAYLVLAMLFIIVRLLALVLLPGIVLQRLCKVAFYFMVERRCELVNASQPTEAPQATPANP